MMVKRKLDGTVDESSADREIRKSDATVRILKASCSLKYSIFHFV